MIYSEIIKALDSETRRTLIQIIKNDPLTLSEIFDEIKNNNLLDIKHRESIYRALEKLVEAKIVKKFYIQNKGLCYVLIVNQILLDIKNEEIKSV